MSHRNLIVTLGFIAVLLGLFAAPAFAAPAFEVELERDLEVVRRGDERLDYIVKTKNVSAATVPASAGEALLCAGAFPIKVWLPVDNRPENSFQWYRDGQPLADETDVLHVTTLADEGKPLQCLVKGENSFAASAQASQPAAIVNPQPAVEPPRPSDPKNAAARPTVTGELGESIEAASFTVKRFCKPPTNWTGAPTWSYRWLSNSEPIPGANGDQYQPVAADEGKILQCMAVATNAGGSVIATSSNHKVGAVSNPPTNNPPANPEVIANPPTLTLELPGGEETYAYKFYSADSAAEAAPSDWGCTKEPAASSEPARAICASFKVVVSGGSYEPLGIAVALGVDAPAHAVATARMAGGGSPEAAEDSDEFDFGPFKPFGVETFEARVSSDPVTHDEFAEEADYTQAGGHPVTGTARIGVATKQTLFRANQIQTSRVRPVEYVKDVVVDTPRGFVGNALAIPDLDEDGSPDLCAGVEALVADPTLCPRSSAVGAIFLALGGSTYMRTIYALEPEFGVPAQFAFAVTGVGGPPVFVFAPHLRADDGYAISLVAAPAPITPALQLAVPTLCGFGWKTAESIPPNNEHSKITCYEPGEAGANEVPLITNPTRCGGAPPTARVLIDSAEHPGVFRDDGYPDLSDPRWKTKSFSNPSITDCEEVKFEPEMEFTPSVDAADSPTGLDLSLKMPTEGLEGKDPEGNPDPEAISQANLKRAKITFPAGMAINPSAGEGLSGCASDQVKLGTNLPISCPDSSKIGSVEIDTPLIRETLTGAIYVGRQAEAPAGSLIGLYLVFESRKDGILIKIPAKVEPRSDGRLITTVDDSPEAPFSAVRMHFAGGPRAALITPPRCGTYRIKAEMAPWSAADPANPTAAETVVEGSTFEVNEGPGGSPCPSGRLEPKLSAGTSNPAAAKTSPFFVRLHRDDGSDRFTSLKLTTPPGLTAYLKGIPYCSDAVLGSIPSVVQTGQAEIDHPACPAASQIGTVSAGAGAGPDPFYARTGKAYLAGPYEGAPLSIAVVAPAVAGPLDLGNVVIRNAIQVDPETAQITAVSDPIPTILHGLPLDVRDIHIAIDRRDFTRNPTDCSELRVGAEVGGESGATANVARSFQATGCEMLDFEPRLNVRLFGGTRRGGHPRLRGTILAKDGEANIGRAAVTIPRSEFLDQAHIRTICTRVQFAAEACPKGAIYGHAKATTPLLDYPVQGPVYLRSSNHKLPDLVVHLKGPDYQPIEAVVVGRIDSIRGQIRTTFETAPDVPISKFTLSMQGGNKGLLINSRDICARGYRATVALEGQNDAPFDTRPLVRNGKCSADTRKSRHGHRRSQK